MTCTNSHGRMYAHIRVRTHTRTHKKSAHPPPHTLHTHIHARFHPAVFVVCGSSSNHSLTPRGAVDQLSTPTHNPSVSCNRSRRQSSMFRTSMPSACFTSTTGMLKTTVSEKFPACKLQLQRPACPNYRMVYCVTVSHNSNSTQS